MGSNPGCVREELITAMNICNNNKNNDQMTGLAGLVNFAASQGNLFSVQGGNDQLIRSAFEQGNAKRNEACQPKRSSSPIQHVTTRISTTVIDFENGMELFDKDGKSLGAYDIVVLAAPLQFSDISFLTTHGSLIV